ncbi:hypothetical protein [Loktanella sp. M215]|uniref:hypothetical protein n=1 Tax=Loktanella sp. M215 TaxID=2675431 RepID=UPI001F161BF5|nr:hypothetical protein [Loktanella sp. M215]MCF7699944.1 hypothetical protein [Loktanella sp. M215]
MVRDFFIHDNRICVVVNDSGKTHFNVYGTTFLLTHGDMLGAKGGDGVIGAIGPIMRGSLKTMKSLSSLDKPVGHLIIGHWHQSLDLPEVTVCGSLKGPDEYAVRMLRVRANEPSQKLIIVHPDHGITFRSNIFLDDEHCPNRDIEAKRSEWVSVFSEDAA